MSIKVRCRLNSDGSVCLHDILESFNAAIREEHAWALCYQCCKFFLSLLGTNSIENCLALSDLNHVFLQTDGNVHPNTFFTVGNNSAAGTSRKNLANEQEFVRGLGVIIYRALDHDTSNGEETTTSRDLEQLIGLMLSEERNTQEGPHHETDDEGIEKDAEEEAPKQLKLLTVSEVMLKCERHLTALHKLQVEAHYKAVIRAFVTEALELSTFLERVAHGTSNLRLVTDSCAAAHLDQLQFSDWARFWMQVMGELRMGVKLRKVRYSKAPIEYELTPYEILMKDIRACRFNLKKIMVAGDTPYRVAKDAHAIILEFIRSRPPLKKASDRKLEPKITYFTPREQLMNSIRNGRTLRSTKNIPRVQLEATQNAELTQRKLIKIDFSQLQDEEDDNDDNVEYSWRREDLNQPYIADLEAYDLAIEDFSARRHTCLGVIEQPWGSQSVPQSRPCSRQSCNSSEADSLPPEMTQSLQDHLVKSWPEGMSLEDRLSLTLEEIVHIRAVLTKAELETLPVEGRVRGDVESRKVCFLCLKTRFGIFGPWGQRCIICKRTVCSRCYSKMNIPMEQFAGVPVALLSPSILATPDDDNRSETSGSRGVTPEPDGESSGSADKSPDSRSNSESDAMRRLKSRAHAVGKAAGVVDKLKGSQLVVCHDCKMMLQQIIKSARTNRTAIRNKTLQSLSLNLSPVF